MIIVTSGASYIDIDAYASAIAYAELLQCRGQNSNAASTATLNESITPSLRALNAPLQTAYTATPDDTFVLVDVSDPEKFDPIVNLEKVTEVFDHHPGNETYWCEKIGEGCQIEPVGAAATLIFEQWQKHNLLQKMSSSSATLLAAAILDNTLDFNASITKERDKTAYAQLCTTAKLPLAFSTDYFSECQQSILADLPESIKNDTKVLVFGGLNPKVTFGQLVLWDASQILEQNLATVTETLSHLGTPWLANIVSISEGKSYFLASDNEVKSWLRGLLNVQFNDLVAPANRLWLRKEILAAALATQ